MEYASGAAAAEAMAVDPNWEELVSGQRRDSKLPLPLHESNSASKQHVSSGLQLISFNPPLLLSNLLAVPLTYRLRGVGNAWVDGQLPVGKNLVNSFCSV